MSHSYTLNVTHVSCSAIDVVTSFVETATPCLGQPVPANTNEFLKVPVSNSKVISLAMPAARTMQNETRLVSLSCTFLSYSCPNPITNVITCHECSSVHSLFRKRECKREKAMGSQVYNLQLQCILIYSPTVVKSTSILHLAIVCSVIDAQMTSERGKNKN